MSATVTVVAYPGTNTLRVADALVAQAQRAGAALSLRFFTETDEQPVRADLAILVFPILGDNRLPDPVEAWLTRRGGLPARAAVCVLGDYDDGAPDRCPVADEAVRLLQQRGVICQGAPLLLDVPLGPLDVSLMDWVWAVLAGGARASVRVDMPIGPTGGEPALQELLALAPGAYCERDAQGRCTSVTLATASAYPRSVIRGASPSRISRIWQCLDRLERLHTLRVPFAGLEGWPGGAARLEDRLVKLDLRGNRLFGGEFVRRLQALRHLNLADNGLADVPPEVFELGKLRTLFLYKNRLASLSDCVGRLRQLRRLSLYRNRLFVLPDSLADCRELRSLNVGANPLMALPAGLERLTNLEELVLRNVDLRVLLPRVQQLRGLRRLDLAKSGLTRAEIVSAGGVPVG